MKKVKKYKHKDCNDVVVCHGWIEHKLGEKCKFCDKIKKYWEEHKKEL